MALNAFHQKVAFVTGGASGIGRALCEALAREGATVVLADLREAAAHAAAAEITAAGGRAHAAALDVRDAAAFRALLEDTAARFGRLDYLFNNAGITVNGEARDLTLADWDEIIAVNLHGVVHGVTAAYPLMVRQGFGHIINTASQAGITPAPWLVPYAATKHAVVGLSISLRAEGADLGVRVSAVCPGLIDTPIIRESRFVSVGKDVVLQNLPYRPASPAACAAAILKGVRRNRGIIVVNWQAKLAWMIYRFSPRLGDWMTRVMLRKYRRLVRPSVVPSVPP